MRKWSWYNSFVSTRWLFLRGRKDKASAWVQTYFPIAASIMKTLSNQLYRICSREFGRKCRLRCLSCQGTIRESLDWAIAID